MRVSVVIPVFNAREYVEEAVDSALSQPETAQVVLVEDGSSDGSLEVCRALSRRHARVQLHRHPDGGNHGAGASRNLGIASATEPCIAFLDADDVYLDDRFATAAELLEGRPETDGVYEAIGVRCEGSRARERWLARGGGELTTMGERVGPEDLFKALVERDRGNCTLDGLVVRSGVFERSGRFYEDLRLHQDTALLIQLAATCRLVPGRLDSPVAVRRVHAGNRYLADYNSDRTELLLWRKLLRWCRGRDLDPDGVAGVYLNAQYYAYRVGFGLFPGSRPRPNVLAGMLVRAVAHPVLLCRAVALRRRRAAGLRNGGSGS
jgi:glycosyltransferase involved in cell wall biosynthesis